MADADVQRGRRTKRIAPTLYAWILAILAISFANASATPKSLMLLLSTQQPLGALQSNELAERAVRASGAGSAIYFRFQAAKPSGPSRAPLSPFLTEVVLQGKVTLSQRLEDLAGAAIGLAGWGAIFTPIGGEQQRKSFPDNAASLAPGPISDDVLVVFGAPKPGQNAAFNRWYTTEHVPDVLKVPGFLSGRRYRLLAQLGKPPAAAGLPPYLVLFRLRSPNLDATNKEIERRIRIGLTRMSSSPDSSRWLGEFVKPISDGGGR